MPVLADTVLVNGMPTNGITVNAYKASRFSGPPALNAAAPTGSADATAVTGTSFGATGAFRMTVPTDEDYYVSATYGTVTGWMGPYTATENADLVQLAGAQTLTGVKQLIGVVDGSSAPAGYVGEVISGTIASGSAVSLSTGAPANVTSIALTAGDWDVTGVVDFICAGTTTVIGSLFIGGISIVSATLGGQDTQTNIPLVMTTGTVTFNNDTPTVRINVSAPTTVYLVAQATFSAGTVKAYGTLRARRQR